MRCRQRVDTRPSLILPSTANPHLFCILLLLTKASTSTSTSRATNLNDWIHRSYLLVHIGGWPRLDNCNSLLVYQLCYLDNSLIVRDQAELVVDVVKEVVRIAQCWA